MSTIQQTGDFAYQEGDRRARAAKATMDSNQNQIVLDSAARIWDPTGSTAADRIRLDQRTGDFVAEGNVNSSRLPDKDQKKSSEMLSGDAPMQATARKMDSKNHNRTIRYEGGVNLWQGANRIQAETVDIDRTQDKKTLVADGKVVTNLWEEPKDDAKKKTATPVLTEVKAGHMVYTGSKRMAKPPTRVFGAAWTRGQWRRADPADAPFEVDDRQDNNSVKYRMVSAISMPQRQTDASAPEGTELR